MTNATSTHEVVNQLVRLWRAPPLEFLDSDRGVLVLRRFLALLLLQLRVGQEIGRTARDEFAVGERLFRQQATGAEDRQDYPASLRSATVSSASRLTASKRCSRCRSRAAPARAVAPVSARPACEHVHETILAYLDLLQARLQRHDAVLNALDGGAHALSTTATTP